jgi:hypothetical protein
VILGRTNIKANPMTNLDECAVTFPVGGIFGVGRLATRLKMLVDGDQIGPWHIGQWTDFRHTAIRIRFTSVADSELAKEICASAAR